MQNRASGILCHITSLPSPFGIGDFGPSAYAFADFLEEARQSYWQVLPLTPTYDSTGNSPYNCLSAFAGNTFLISPEMLRDEGYLSDADLALCKSGKAERIDFAAVSASKYEILSKAYRRFKETIEGRVEYDLFCTENDYWLKDYCAYSVLNRKFDEKELHLWPAAARNRQGDEFKYLLHDLEGEIEKEKFLQYIFFRQWYALKRYCNNKGVLVIGDFPFFMNTSSADVWCLSSLFKVDLVSIQPHTVAGAPPDSFAKNGQLFNCVAYDWDRMQQERYAWWIARLKQMFKMYDVLRVDHFRGLVACWEVPAGEKTALNGRWQKVPFYDFMSTLLKHVPSLPIYAEDLGMITPDVREGLHAYGIPGIKMLLYGFAKEMRDDSFLLHNHEINSVVFTGTHDTNTCQGWFDKNDNKEDKELFFKYIGRELHEGASWEFVRLAMMSVSRTAIIPIQDVLGLGEEARMNTPGQTSGNWQWRLEPGQVTPEIGRKLAELTTRYGRA